MQICFWEKRFLANIYLLYRHFSKLAEKLDNREKRHDNSINKRTDLIMTLRDYETNFPFYLSLSKDEITSNTSKHRRVINDSTPCEGSIMQISSCVQFRSSCIKVI